MAPVATARQRLGFPSKVFLFLWIWFWFFAVQTRVHRDPLPEAIAKLRPVKRRKRMPMTPRRLGAVVRSVLSVGPYRPRCLVNALVDYRLLLEQGIPAELVIGLPSDARDHQAHAWIEIDGIDVGPPPGRAAHIPLARYS